MLTSFTNHGENGVHLSLGEYTLLISPQNFYIHPISGKLSYPSRPRHVALCFGRFRSTPNRVHTRAGNSGLKLKLQGMQSLLTRSLLPLGFRPEGGKS